MENFIDRSHKLYFKENLSDAGDSSSHHVAETSSSLMIGSEVNQLSERVKILEEEGEAMREVFFESMEERKRLMDEIYDKFMVIQHYCLLSRNQERGERNSGVLIINPHKNGRRGTGLSQVLRQESNPSLVLRDLRTTALTLEDIPAKLIYEFSNSCPQRSQNYCSTPQF